MNRVQFEEGKQKEFLKNVMETLQTPSLRSLMQFGIITNYATLKNFYTERRCLPENLFNNLCYLAKIDKNTLDFTIKKETWGQVKGGKISKRRPKRQLLSKQSQLD